MKTIPNVSLRKLIRPFNYPHWTSIATLAMTTLQILWWAFYGFPNLRMRTVSHRWASQNNKSFPEPKCVQCLSILAQHQLQWHQTPHLNNTQHLKTTKKKLLLHCAHCASKPISKIKILCWARTMASQTPTDVFGVCWCAVSLDKPFLVQLSAAPAAANLPAFKSCPSCVIISTSN